MKCLPLRLEPGSDLRATLEAAASAGAGMSAFVASGIGSLSGARLRLAGAESETEVEGDVEILSLSGTLAPDGAHLHMAVADATGHVIGGHVCYGNMVRTTAELLVLELVEWSLAREPDRSTGFEELVIRARSRPPKEAP